MDWIFMLYIIYNFCFFFLQDENGREVFRMLLDLFNYGNVSFDLDYIVIDRGFVNWIKILDGREKRVREVEGVGQKGRVVKGLWYLNLFYNFLINMNNIGFGQFMFYKF